MIPSFIRTLHHAMNTKSYSSVKLLLAGIVGILCWGVMATPVEAASTSLHSSGSSIAVPFRMDLSPNSVVPYQSHQIFFPNTNYALSFSGAGDRLNLGVYDINNPNYAGRNLNFGPQAVPTTMELRGADGTVIPGQLRQAGNWTFDLPPMSQAQLESLRLSVNTADGPLVSNTPLNIGGTPAANATVASQDLFPPQGQAQPPGVGPPPGSIGAKPGPAGGTVPGARAKGGGLVPCGQDKPCTLEEIKTLGRNIFNFLLGLGAVAAVAAIVVGGFRYMTARGDTKALAEAKQTVTWAVIGLIILLLAFVIVNTILTALGTKSEFTQ